MLVPCRGLDILVLLYTELLALAIHAQQVDDNVNDSISTQVWSYLKYPIDLILLYAAKGRKKAEIFADLIASFRQDTQDGSPTDRNVYPLAVEVVAACIFLKDFPLSWVELWVFEKRLSCITSWWSDSVWVWGTQLSALPDERSFLCFQLTHYRYNISHCHASYSSRLISSYDNSPLSSKEMKVRKVLIMMLPCKQMPFHLHPAALWQPP